MNTNCLKGVMCPKCGHTERFALLVPMWVIVEDEGTDPNVAQAIEWDKDTVAACKACSHQGRLATFSHPGFYVTFDVVTEESAEHGDAERRGWWEPGGWEYDDKPEEPAYSFDPDDFDEAEHGCLDDAILDWAVKLLNSEGATHSSSSPWSPRGWVSTDAEKNHMDGSSMVRSFHFHGFSHALITRIAQEVVS